MAQAADHARAHGAPIDFEAAWLTLTVWSSLEAVGLTAAVSAALTGVVASPSWGTAADGAAAASVAVTVVACPFESITTASS